MRIPLGMTSKFIDFRSLALRFDRRDIADEPLIYGFSCFSSGGEGFKIALNAVTLPRSGTPGHGRTEGLSQG